MSLEQNKATIRRWLDVVWNGGDIATVDQMLAPDYTNSAGLDRDGLKAMIAGMRNGMPDVRLELEDLIAEGNAVVARFIVTGTHSGSVMGETPTGKKVATHGMAYFRLADGKIAEDESVATPDLRQELGIQMPSPTSVT